MSPVMTRSGHVDAVAARPLSGDDGPRSDAVRGLKMTPTKRVFKTEQYPQFCRGKISMTVERVAVPGVVLCTRPTWERDMAGDQSSKSGSSPSSIECPRCPHCQGRMTLAAISPAPPGYDLRTFECAKCDRISTKLVPTDPMKTGDVLRWLDGELKPPD
jgi:hypothetical protein